MAVESFANSAFLVTALHDGIRVDGRSLAECRRLSFRFSHLFGQVEVSLGNTIVACVIQSEIVEPHHSRPNEGFLMVNVDFKSIRRVADDASVADAMEICSLIEKLLKGCRAVDVEALCILGAEKVWLIRVDLHVLNNDGNLMDTCTIAAVAGVLHFRLREVSVTGNIVTAASLEDCDPVPLCIHHVPFSITLAQFEGSDDLFVVDPLLAEESAMSGRITVAINQYGELCNVHKPGGKSISFSHLQQCIQSAAATAKQFADSLNKAIEEDRQVRVIKAKNISKRYSLPTIHVDSSMVAGKLATVEQAILSSILLQKGLKRQLEDAENTEEVDVSYISQHSAKPVNTYRVEPVDLSFSQKDVDAGASKLDFSAETSKSNKIDEIVEHSKSNDLTVFARGDEGKCELLTPHDQTTSVPKQSFHHNDEALKSSEAATHHSTLFLGETGTAYYNNTAERAYESLEVLEERGSGIENLPIDLSEEMEFEAAVIKKKKPKFSKRK
ncbi:3' exoribonuclease family, domain 1 domain-containing protein [Cardiosporidium cionae]|uniref:3' exoribonuclease family, domain 1 domain-containing protein n=1 Tax=Cardiosporidium cionae TaxID=476202 RepID=A0ABQ7JC09_9APIC|nr:3' exoribonuclease family, domain 1 domain-containing protein [Cardiosporidium cionae]|eukprot:KAF8821558.1 3' exoribonuclease family, domain 1 domain-containing protein [Cardiosporidium cionae]